MSRRLTNVTRIRTSLRLASVLLVGLVAACGPSGGSGGDSGATAALAGSVVAGPACPVEQAGTPCPPNPVPSALVQLLDESTVVAQTRTGADGRFHLLAPPGRFMVPVASEIGLPSEVMKSVRLRTGDTTTVEMMLDSGIR